MDNCVEVNQHLLASPGKCEQFGVTTKKPKFARYAIRSNREESFKAWPQYVPVGKEGLIEAGLVYTGVGDSVRCYHCGGGLRNWEAGDKPMLEHAKWYPECAHVLLVKGQEYIDAAGRGEDWDVITASKSQPSKKKDKYKLDIKCVAAQSCLEMGYTITDVETAMSKFISKQGNDNFKARDLLEIILDAREQEPDMTGACNVLDCQDEADDVEEEEDDKGVGDLVRCNHCGGGLRNWEDGGKPMLEHAKWYPEYDHVLLVKGQEYIDATGRGKDLDAITASKSKSLPSKKRDHYKLDIKCVAAQSCLEMGYPITDVQTAMSKFISKHGYGNFKARDLLEIILDAREQESEITGARNVLDCQDEADDVKEEEDDKEELEKMKDENQRIKERQLCKICQEDQSSILFLPCGHLVACPQCAPALLKCPICRLEVKGQVRAHLA